MDVVIFRLFGVACTNYKILFTKLFIVQPVYNVCI